MNQSEDALPESLLFRVPRARWLTMSDDCDAATADQLVARLHELGLASREPIVIEINCNRADFWGALRLYDAIRFLGAPVIGFVNGSACTGAIVVLQGCETRIATAASEVFLQPPLPASLDLPLTLSTTKETALDAMEAHRSLSEHLRQRVEDVLNVRIGRSPEQIRPMTDASRVFLSARAALAEGLFDLLTRGVETDLTRN